MKCNEHLLSILGKLRFLFYGLLFAYAFFHHISSSEFWPVTIAKTWLGKGGPFEDSVLQKPLLTLLLAPLHWLALNDLQHIVLVKIIFSLLGLLSLILFSLFFAKKASLQLNDPLPWPHIVLVSLSLLLVSPTYLNNFFSIRSDQLAFLLFCIFLLICELQLIRVSFLILLLIPLAGVKESFFVVPGALYYFIHFKKSLSKKTIFFTIYSALCVFTWVIALNMQATFYLSETYKNITLIEQYRNSAFRAEIPLIVLSFLAGVFLLIRRRHKHLNTVIMSFVFIIILLSLPQSYAFFIASIIPFIVLPLFTLFYELPMSDLKRTLSLIVVLGLFFHHHHLKNGINYSSNQDQLQYIQLAGDFLEKNKLSYLDGMGLLPRATFHPCFVSPYDDWSNNSCFIRLRSESPAVIIITKRLAYLGEEVFKIAQENYEQIYPNLWLHKSKLNETIKASKKLDGLPIPIIIF